MTLQGEGERKRKRRRRSWKGRKGRRTQSWDNRDGSIMRSPAIWLHSCTSCSCGANLSNPSSASYDHYIYHSQAEVSKGVWKLRWPIKDRSLWLSSLSHNYCTEGHSPSTNFTSLLETSKVPLKKERDWFFVLFRAPLFLDKWCGVNTYFLYKKNKKN